MATVITDNFNRTDAADLGANWTSLEDHLNIVSNQCKAHDHANGVQRHNTDVGSPNMKVYQTFISGSNNVLARVSGTNTYYDHQPGASSGNCWRRVSGSWTQIGSGYTRSNVNGEEIRLEVNGSSFKAYMNGSSVLEATDTNITTGNYAGIRGGLSDAICDNFGVDTFSTDYKMQINIGDVWKAVAGIQINIGDTWKTVTSAKINIGDSWKTIFAYLLLLPNLIKQIIK